MKSARKRGRFSPLFVFVFLIPFAPSRSMLIQLRVANGLSPSTSARQGTIAGAGGLKDCCHGAGNGFHCPRVVTLTLTAPALLSGARRCVQNTRSHSEGVYTYVERVRAGIEKRIIIKWRNPFAFRERVSTLNAFINAKSFHRAKCLNGLYNYPFVFRSVRTSARRPLDPNCASRCCQARAGACRIPVLDPKAYLQTPRGRERG